MSLVVARQRAPLDIARSFAFTLVPIAIGYHVAHYLTFLLVQGQYIIPLVSDPFGYGWNLFGTAGYRVDIAIVGARFAWYAALAAVLTGHIAAVYFAHRKAMAMFTGWGLRAAFAGAAHRADGGLYLRQPLHPRRAGGRAARARAAFGRGRRCHRSPRTPCFPSRAAGACWQSGRARCPGETDLPRVRLRVSRRLARRQPPISFMPPCLPIAGAFAATGAMRTTILSIDVATALLRRHLVAFRMAGTDAGSKSFRVGDVNFTRELFIIDVYASIAPEDPEQEAAVLPPWSNLPWPVLVLMEEAVSRGFAAFSQAEATRRGVEWLDLVRSEQTNAKLAALVEMFARDGYRPEPLQPLVSVDEARRRWIALAAFYKTYGHFLVTNGPYRLKRWAADSVNLEAFRDLSYPLGVGSFDAYAIPRRGFVTAVAWNGNRATLKGDIEVLDKFQRSYRLVRTPLQSLAPEVARRAAPECSLHRRRRSGARRADRPRQTCRGFHVSDRPRRPPAGGTLYDVRRDRACREPHECGDPPCSCDCFVDPVMGLKNLAMRCMRQCPLL